MNVCEQEIHAITDMVWSCVLDLGLDLRVEDPAPERRGGRMVSCVRLAGSWRGAVTVACSPDLARRAAGIMCGVDPADASMLEVQDALGELANMIGGNIKALLPGPTTLSLPTALEVDDPTLAGAYVAQVCTVAFESQNEPLIISVFESP